MKIAIVGSRGFRRLWKVNAYISELPKDAIIVSGGAYGVDALAVAAGRRYGLAVIEILPDWEKFGKAAGMMRNSDIVAQCDRLVAFWDGMSRGTKDSIDKARKAGKRVEIITA